jgi:hypothetical protein
LKINKENSSGNKKERSVNQSLRKSSKKKSEKSSLIGKRDSYDKEQKPGKLLTKKQRRNKHCKQNFEWLLEESQEIKKKKTGSNAKTKDQKLISATKFVLKRDLRGLGISFFNNNKRNKNISRNTVKPVFPMKNEKKETKHFGENRKISLKKTDTGLISFQGNVQGNSKKVGTANSKAVTGKTKDFKGIPKMVWNSRGQCDETTKLRSKINKVRTYWNRTSLLIPNVFRHVCELKKNSSMLFEYLDLSRKELLVQANGQKAISQAGAPHLQRKNKMSKKSSAKKDLKSGGEIKEGGTSVKEQPHFESEQSEERQDWMDSVNTIQHKINNKSEEIKETQENVKSVHSTKTSSERSDQDKGVAKSQERGVKVPVIEKKEETLEEKECVLNIKLEKIKKQLREDMNKVHQRIEKSFISEKKKNWTKMDLKVFNQNISEYNQLLDEQDQLKTFQQKKQNRETVGPLTMFNQTSLKRLEKKIIPNDFDLIKKRVSKILTRQESKESHERKTNQDSDLHLELTLQDILKMELQVSAHKKPETSPLTKLSKRIQKKRQDNPKKKHSLCTDLPSTRKRGSTKKASFFSTHEKNNSQEEQEVQILFGFKEEELIVSVNEESLEDMSTDSLHSLDLPKLLPPSTRTSGNMLIRN